jgi:hypothetical protein
MGGGAARRVAVERWRALRSRAPARAVSGWAVRPAVRTARDAAREDEAPAARRAGSGGGGGGGPAAPRLGSGRAGVDGMYWSVVLPELSIRLVDAAQRSPLSGPALVQGGHTFDQCVDELVSGNGWPARKAAALAATSTCGMGHLLQGLSAYLGSPLAPRLQQRLSASCAAMEAALQAGLQRHNPNNERHMRALLELWRGRPQAACALWEQSLLCNPVDVLALRCAQQTYLLRGDRRAALACVERVMGVWEPHFPSYSRVAALLARGLFENGLVAEGEEAAGRALTISSDNVVATLATAHGFLAAGRFREGQRVLRELESTLQDVASGSSQPTTHLGLELFALRSLLALEPAKTRVAVALYDEAVGTVSGAMDDRGEGAGAVAPLDTIGFGLSALVLLNFQLFGLTDAYFADVRAESRRPRGPSAAVAGWLPWLDRDGAATPQGAEQLALADARQASTPGPGASLSFRFQQLLSRAGPDEPEELDPMQLVLRVGVLLGAGASDRAAALIAASAAWAAAPAADGDDGVEGVTPELALTAMGACVPPRRAMHEVAVPIARALLAMDRGETAQAAATLLTLRPRFDWLGAAALQHDMLERMLLVAALRAAGVPLEHTNERVLSYPAAREVPEALDTQAAAQERYSLWLARALINERVARCSLSPLAWEWHSRVHSVLGRPDTAESSSLRSLDLGFRQGGHDAH